MSQILLSLIIPTRSRTASLERLLQSLAETTSLPTSLEVVLGIDTDDIETQKFVFNAPFEIKRVPLSPGLTMGAMNNICLNASVGAYKMLMNDDVIVRTLAWDAALYRKLTTIKDDVFLAQVNDLLFKDKLCCFPIFSQKTLAIVPHLIGEQYERYRIDDHVYDIFQTLAILGHKRIYYFPDVIFEHLNFEHNKSKEREYSYNPEILKRDAERFNSSAALRRQAANDLAEHIETQPITNSRKFRSAALASISGSRCPTNASNTQWITSTTAAANPNRTTIGLVCSNIKNYYTQDCIDRIKRHTSNYELVIIDNARSPDFNHAREMNRIMSLCQNKYLVLLDDDVLVEPDWLPAMLEAMTENVACVTPVHLNGDGHISYAGVYVGDADKGDHAHLLNVPTVPIPIPTICSAVMAIDMERCGHLRFDEKCLKYFHDLDFGLQVWDAGFEVALSPKVPLIHLGGATLKHRSKASILGFERDRQVFNETWINSGRLRNLINDRWKFYQEINSLYDAAKTLADYLGQMDQIPPSADYFEKYGDNLPALRPSLLKAIQAFLASLSPEQRSKNSEFYSSLISQLTQSSRIASSNEATDRVNALVEKWKLKGNRIVVYPAGNFAADLLKNTNLLQANIVALGDNNSMLEGSTLWGMPVLAPSNLSIVKPDTILVASPQYEDEIITQLRALHGNEIEIIGLN